MQTVDNNSNNNSATFKTGVNLAGLVGGAAIGGSAAKDYFRHKGAEYKLKKLTNPREVAFINYANNRYLEHKSALEALDEKKFKNKKDYNKKVKELKANMMKYRAASNGAAPNGKFSISAYNSKEYGNNDALNIIKAKLSHKNVLEEYNKEKTKYVKELEDTLENKLKSSKIKAGGALATVASGFAIPYITSKISRNNAQNQLSKTSNAIFAGPEDDLSDDEKDKIQTYTAQNKSSFLPAMGLGMFAGGVGAEKLGDKLIKEQKINEGRMKQHAADADQHARNIQQIEEQMGKIADKHGGHREANKSSEEYRKLASKKSELMTEFNKSRAKGLHATIAATLNNGNHLKSLAPTLKWGALPVGIVGGYQLLSKRTNPDNPGLIKDPDTASKIHAVGTLSMIAGLGLMGKGLYRPLIKPMGEASKKFKEIEQESADSEKAFKEYMKERTKMDGKDINYLSARERDAAKNEMGDRYVESLNKVKDSSVDTDAKYLASGSALLSAGVVGSKMFPTDDVLKNEEKEYNLQKQNRKR